MELLHCTFGVCARSFVSTCLALTRSHRRDGPPAHPRAGPDDSSQNEATVFRGWMKISRCTANSGPTHEASCSCVGGNTCPLQEDIRHSNRMVVEVNGECYCGQVKFTASVPADDEAVEKSVAFTAYCHCGDCKRAHSSPLYQVAMIVADGFRYTQGEELVNHYRKSAETGPERSFCSVCGTRMTIQYRSIKVEGKPTIGLFPALLDDAMQHSLPKSLQPKKLNKPDSSTLDFELLTGSSKMVVEVNGECYCGLVKFTASVPADDEDVDKSPVVVTAYCNCEDCRRAHSSPLYQVAYVTADALRFTHGEELVNRYRKSADTGPERSFCSICGTRVTIRSSRLTVFEGKPVIGFFPALLDDATQHNLPKSLQPKKVKEPHSCTLDFELLTSSSKSQQL